jgi:hypothetical protein
MVEIVYAQHRTALKPGQVQRNPRFFQSVEPDAKRVLVHGHWPALVQAHRDAGVKVERIDAVLEPPAVINPAPELAARLADRIVPREGRSGGVALVLGSAGCVWDDAMAALDLGVVNGAVGCNLAAIHWPGVLDAWVSLHSDKFKLWAAWRARQGLPKHKAQIGLEQTLPHFKSQFKVGSSGLYALKVALIDMGFDRAVLCGVPLSADAAHFDDPKPWKSANIYRGGFNEAFDEIKDRTRSMSGWTMSRLGKPDAEWLEMAQ